MMNDVSVLLNLTGKLVFEKTNPLLDLVGGHGPLLFYDQLSLERFPLAQEEQERHVWQLLVSLRNLLGSRRLSVDDKGGKIRLIVTLDLVGGFSHPSGQTLWFPAQKVRQFMEMLNRVFEKEPQLRSRFEYSFVFMEWDADNSELAKVYRSLAYDGCYGQPAAWLSSEMLTANGTRDRLIATQAPLADEVSLDNVAACSLFATFQKALQEQVARIATILSRAGLDQPFRNLIPAGVANLKTIGDFRTFDFDELFRHAVSQLAGLRALLLGNSSFFIFRMRTDTITHRKKDEAVFFSFLQLLATRTASWPARFTVVDASMNEHSLNVEAIARLKSAVSAVLHVLRSDGAFKWSPTMKVSYSVYSANNVKTEDSNDYYKQNEEIDASWKQLYGEFCRLRQVPFFFGSAPGDWSWYSDVLRNLDEIYDFTVEHDRPLYASSGRITDKEMKVEHAEASYTELELKQKQLEAKKTSVNLLADLKEYLKSREKPLATLEEQKEKLKTEMTKLGFASTTRWISLVSCVIITLCYSLHFIYTGGLAESVWTGACLGVVGIVCCLAAWIAQIIIKSGIDDIFAVIDDSLVKIDGQKQAYLKSINNRVSMQNESDIRRKNLDELRGKLRMFANHNMQVELWEKHFTTMEAKLSDMLQYVGESALAHESAAFRIDDDDLDIEQMPSIPIPVGEQFQKMTTKLSQGMVFENVTCFLNQLNVTCDNN